MNVIKTITQGCDGRCSIVQGHSSSTLMGWSQSYDKNGKPQGRDPNTTTTHYHCATCRVRWEIKSGGFRPKVEIVRIEPVAT